MKLENIIEFRDWLFDFTAKMKNDHILGEQEVLYFVKDKFSSLGLNDNKIDKEEPVDEDKLNRLAYKASVDAVEKYIFLNDEQCYNEGFKEGYRKRAEEET